MTETDWLAADDPYPLIQHLGQEADPRKLRLFAVACCRRISHRLSDVRSIMAVAVAERFADGLVGEAVLTNAVQAARRAYENALNIHDGASFAPVWLSTQPLLTAVSVATHCGQAVGAGESAVQADLLRDILGNPYRPAADCDPAWLRWRDGTIPAWHSRCMNHATSPACRSWPTLWKRPAAPAAKSSTIAKGRGRTCGDAGWWI